MDLSEEVAMHVADTTPRRRWWTGRARPAPLPTEHWTTDPGPRPRVLVECPDSAMVWALERVLEDAGYEVAACAGPSAHATCALARTGRCELQAGADVIVNGLGPGEIARGVARDTAVAYPDTPLVVGATGPGAGADETPPPPGVRVLRAPWSAPLVVAEVDAALAGGAPPHGPGGSETTDRPETTERPATTG